MKKRSTTSRWRRSSCVRCSRTSFDSYINHTNTSQYAQQIRYIWIITILSKILRVTVTYNWNCYVSVLYCTTSVRKITCCTLRCRTWRRLPNRQVETLYHSLHSTISTWQSLRVCTSTLSPWYFTFLLAPPNDWTGRLL